MALISDEPTVAASQAADMEEEDEEDVLLMAISSLSSFAGMGFTNEEEAEEMPENMKKWPVQKQRKKQRKSKVRQRKMLLYSLLCLFLLLFLQLSPSRQCYVFQSIFLVLYCLCPYLCLFHESLVLFHSAAPHHSRLNCFPPDHLLLLLPAGAVEGTAETVGADVVGAASARRRAASRFTLSLLSGGTTMAASGAEDEADTGAVGAAAGRTGIRARPGGKGGGRGACADTDRERALEEARPVNAGEEDKLTGVNEREGTGAIVADVWSLGGMGKCCRARN